jgi:signal transduction histidine kinase
LASKSLASTSLATLATTLFLTLALSGTARAEHSTEHSFAKGTLQLIQAQRMRVTLRQPHDSSTTNLDPVGKAVDVDSKFEAVSLPDDWDKAVPMRTGLYCYSLTIPANLKPAGLSALYIPRAGNSVWVEFNGHLVGEFGAAVPPYPNYAGYPLHVLLPEHLFVPGEQKIAITIAGNEFSHAGLSPVYFGPLSVIEGMVNASTWSQVHGVWVLSGATGVIGLMSLLLWMRIRQRVYLYFAIASLVWAFRLQMPLDISPWLPPQIWTWLYFNLFSVYITFVVLFAIDVIGHKGQGIRRSLWAFLAASAVLLTVGIVFSHFQLRAVVLLMSILVSLGATVLVFRETYKQPEVGRILLCFAGMAVLIAGTRDYMIVQNDISGYAIPTWGRYASIMFMFVLAWIVMERFSRAMQSYQTSARFYELQFSRKQAELEATYDHLRGAEKRQAVEDERRRIMREMHDGLGSSLVTAMSLVDHDDAKQNHLSDALNNCMGELRMAVDALQPHDNDLLAALGTLRTRITPALERAGMKLKWEVEQIPAIERLTPETTLHLYRFVQEAISNAIKHSGATSLTLRTSFDWRREWVSVMIDDNGKGWRPFAPGVRKGGGSDSLRARAHALGGIARIIDMKPGTRVQLSFPRGVVSDVKTMSDPISTPDSGFVNSHPSGFGPTQPMSEKADEAATKP